MNEAKIINLCQMALRARKAVFGGQLLPAVQSRKARVVIYAQDMGANTRKKIQDKCRSYQVPCIEMSDQAMADISFKPIKALGITDAGFAQAVLKAWKG